MLKMSITVGTEKTRKVLYAQQFHVRYGESFIFTFQDDEERTFSIKFTQKINKKNDFKLFPFFQDTHSPYFEVDKSSSYEELCYILGNFNQPKVTTNLVPFYAKMPLGHYCFQLSAISISEEVNNEETIWLYTVTIYETDR